MFWSLLAAPVLAQDDVAEEIVVWGDLFARWDDTRWLVKTEVGMPFELVFAADMNKELQVREFQVAAVLHCSKDWKLSGKKYEVGCALEDVAVQAAVSTCSGPHIASPGVCGCTSTSRLPSAVSLNEN